LARTLLQTALMAAVVATLLYVPVVVALALLLRLVGISPESVATFGGALGLFSGLFAWWLLTFQAACIYAACAFPWREEADRWQKKK
jgi:hypothetical protein